jgi:hypothetical protein
MAQARIIDRGRIHDKPKMIIQMVNEQLEPK